MKVLIIGNGVSGLSFARILQQLQPQTQISIFDSRAYPDCSPDRGLGLWPNAQNVLSQIDTSQILTHKYRYITPASYRDIRGNWLSSASQKNSIKVATILENQVREMLQDNLSKVNFHYNTKINEIIQTDQNVMIQSTEKQQFTGDYVVYAGGQSDSFRTEIFGEQYTLEKSPLISISGVVQDYSMNIPAYETLNQGNRFAVVPLKNGIFWFCHMQKNENTWFSQLNDNIPMNDNENQLIKSIIFNKFKNYHAPIPQIIEQTDPNSLVKRSYYNGKSLDKWYNHRIVAIGDACHIVEPNLAQGASVAIEDSWELAKAVSENPLENAFQIYQQRRLQRINRYKLITKFTQLLAHQKLNYVTPLMQFVPNPLNSFIFDQFLRQSLGGSYHIQGKND